MQILCKCCTCEYYNRYAGNFSCEHYPNGIPIEEARDWEKQCCERYVKADTSEEHIRQKAIKWFNEHPDELDNE